MGGKEGLKAILTVVDGNGRGRSEFYPSNNAIVHYLVEHFPFERFIVAPGTERLSLSNGEGGVE